MEVLYALSELRNPILDEIMLFITALGEETFFMIGAMTLLWCHDKYEGYYMLFVGFLGIQINQLLKVSFRIERPWVADKSFKPVKKALPEATGYSFPSGHTQVGVGTAGSIAATKKHLAIRILGFSAIILIPLSRLYLGVHTPLDVAVSFIIAAALVLILYPVMKILRKSHKAMRIMLLSLTVITAALAAYMTVTLWGKTHENLVDGLNNSYKMLGAILGMWAVFELDTRFIHYETRAVWWAQLIKLVLGLALTAAIKELCPLIFGFFSSEIISCALTYFIVVLFAGALWPLSFKYFSRLGNKK